MILHLLEYYFHRLKSALGFKVPRYFIEFELMRVLRKMVKYEEREHIDLFITRSDGTLDSVAKNIFTYLLINGIYVPHKDIAKHHSHFHNGITYIHTKKETPFETYHSNMKIPDGPMGDNETFKHFSNRISNRIKT